MYGLYKQTLQKIVGKFIFICPDCIHNYNYTMLKYTYYYNDRFILIKIKQIM